jgi:transaldolase
MNIFDNLNISLFADGAEKARILELCRDPRIKGFTTNPSLMRKAGVTDYEVFAREVTPCLNNRPISFEVFSDDFEEMRRQALYISSWGPNVYVKIPITNTHGHSSVPLLRYLATEGVKVNVTAIMTFAQVEAAAKALEGGPDAYISVFAGRIADAGRDPLPLVRSAVDLLKPTPNVRLIWASTREVYNIIQAAEAHCHIITVTYDLLSKLSLIGRDLEEFSLDTVKMFYNDAVASCFSLKLPGDMYAVRAAGK